MKQVFVPWTLSKTWGKYSSGGRIPSSKQGATIRPLDEYPLQHMGQVFVLWMNTLSSTWGKYSSTDEYPLKNTGQVLVHGRIPLQKHGANIRPPTNNVSETWGEYLLEIRIGLTVRIVARKLLVDEYNRYI